MAPIDTATLQMEAIKHLSPATSKLTDEEVVIRVIQGEKGLYEILMRRCNQRLYRAVRSYLQDDADIADTMQDTYVRAYEKLSSFRREAAFPTWLIRIGINEALQRLKRERALRSHIDHDVCDEGLIHLPDTNMRDPEERLIQREASARLERAIDSLPELYRVVYMLREVEGSSVAEVAAILDLTESNVKVRLHRAKALLKEALFELHAGDETFTFGNTHCDLLVALVMARIGETAFR